MVNNKVCSKDIINGIGAGLSLLDRNFRILWVNKCESDWVGPKHKLLGRKCYETFERRKHICRGCPALKVWKTGVVHQANRIGFNKEGKKRYYHLTVSPIKDGKDQVAFALELIQDVTDKVLLEKRNVRFIRKLKELYHHLSRVNQRLQSNIQRLKGIIRHLSAFKVVLDKKYHHKIHELVKIKEELRDIFKINRALSSTIDIRKIVTLITRLSCELTNTDACCLRIMDPDTKLLYVSATYGLSEAFQRTLNDFKLGESICGKAAETRKCFIIEDVLHDPRVTDTKRFQDEGIRSAMCFPIFTDHHILGTLTLFSKKKTILNNEEIEGIKIFVSQVSVAIQESRHFEDLHVNYFNTVHALMLAEEARDPYTRGHTERVTKYALAIARELNLSEAEREILRYAAEVHDIGKIGIPDMILAKPGRLTPAERAVIELHPIKGEDMLEPLDFLKAALPAVRHHHERYDGTGYPDGLEKEKIPLLARILSCADAFDAMTSERPYRCRKLSVEEAIQEIKNNVGSQFDPHIVNTFIKTIRNQCPQKALQ